MHSQLKKAWLHFAVLIATIVVLNVAGQYLYTQLDLTEEQRFTLSEPTRDVVGKVEEPAFFTVFLGGEYPASFERLPEAIREKLRTLQQRNGNIEFEFVDPTDGPLDSVRVNAEQLERLGIRPFSVPDAASGRRSDQLTFPGALLQYRGQAIPINFIDRAVRGEGIYQLIDNAVARVEYKLARALQKGRREQPPVIAMTTGNGELDPLQTADLANTLQQSYLFGRIYWDSVSILPQDIDVLIVAKPRTEFTEREKFLLDQYIMHGGKVIWLIDRIGAELDSLQQQPRFYPVDYPLAIEDLLYRYGIRIQPNLLLDLENTPIPIGKDDMKFELVPWYYYPTVRPISGHPIVRSLDRVDLRFASTIDTTIRVPQGVERTLLLGSSRNSSTRYLPTEVSFDIIAQQPGPEAFQQTGLPVGVLLEGVFPSHYQQTARQAYLELLRKNGLEYRAESVPTAMIVISDGDLIRNEVDPNMQNPYPLDYNRTGRYRNANKDFILNAIEYLVEEEDLMVARIRDTKIRLLDEERVAQERSYWQFVNIGLPLLLLIVFGLLYAWWRRRRYGYMPERDTHD